MAKDVMAEVVQMGPPATIVGLTLWGITLQDWVLIFSLALILMQIAWFLWSKVIKPVNAWRNGRAVAEDPDDG